MIVQSRRDLGFESRAISIMVSSTIFKNFFTESYSDGVVGGRVFGVGGFLDFLRTDVEIFSFCDLLGLDCESFVIFGDDAGYGEEIDGSQNFGLRSVSSRSK